MSFERIISEEAIKHLPKSNNLRKRYLVNEGDLFQLYKEIRQVRSQEDRERFMKDFRALLRDTVPVKIVVQLEKRES